MGPSTDNRPKVSVIVPTYNRQELLRLTLRSLARQRLDPGEFEVIVSDDGSADATAEVAKSFDTELSLHYRHQDDLGFRAATARNEGAWLASAPTLVFLDTGVVAGPDFVRGHRDAHAAHPDGGLAVLGYTFGYRPRPLPDLAEALAHQPPEQILDQYADNPDFRDWRHDVFTQVDFDLTRRAVPWKLFWTLNLSVSAADFRAAGGFDEDFQGWGAEDLELGYRLHRRDVSIVGSRACWAIDAPHERDLDANLASNRVNIQRFLDKHPTPVVELCWAGTRRNKFWPIEEYYVELLAWSREVQARTVREEIAAALAGVPGGTRIVVFGCGGSVPETLPPVVLADFDADALSSANADGLHRVVHAIGVRTTLPDDSADLVLITSRLSGLWDRWGEQILDEAHRIGRAVHRTFDGTPLP